MAKSAPFQSIAPFKTRLRPASSRYRAFAVDYINPPDPALYKYGCMAIAPINALSSCEFREAADPANVIITVSNVGGATISWSGSSNQAWLTLDVASGTLAPGASINVTATINSTGQLPGTHTAVITFVNVSNGCGDGTVSIQLDVAGTLPSITADFASESATPSLVGFSEYSEGGSPSDPPKKYRTQTTVGTLNSGSFPTNACAANACLPGYPTEISVTINGWTDAFGGSHTGTFTYTLKPQQFISATNRWRYVLSNFSVTGADCFGSPLSVQGVIVDTHPGTGDTAWVVLSGNGKTVDLQYCPNISWNFNSFIRAYCGGWIIIAPPGSSGQFVAPRGGSATTASLDTFNTDENYNITTGAYSRTELGSRYTDVGEFPVSGGTLDPSGPDLTSYSGFTSSSGTKTQRIVSGNDGCAIDGSAYRKTTGSVTQTLTDEDTEADAIARATFAAGTSPTAKREQRGAGEFSFEYVTVDYTLDLSGLMVGESYVVTIDILTEDYGGGNGATSQRTYAITATGVTDQITDSLVAASGKQVTASNPQISFAP